LDIGNGIVLVLERTHGASFVATRREP
jgi:hypothetical protein